MDKKAILSIDGGGIRGIIPATVLVRLEEVTGKPARESFSFVAGTSTGAIIAAALAAEVPAREIRKLYLSLAQEIFPSGPFKLIRRIISGSMYSGVKLHQAIAKALGAKHTLTLNEAQVDLLLTAKRVPDGKPWYFVKDTPKNSCTGRLNIVDCAVASASAPTYFPPFEMPQPGGPPPGCQPVGLLVDGGVGVAGNPIYEACLEAFVYMKGYVPEETRAVSLGTGSYTQTKRPTWIYPWLNWVLAELLESPEEQQTDVVSRLYPDMEFYRIDTKLLQNIGMDDARHIDELAHYGEQLANQVDWEAILSGRDERFRVRSGKTRHRAYAYRP